MQHALVSAFDGAGKPYKGPSYKGGIAVLIAVIVGVALIWLVYSAALDGGDNRNSVPDTITLEEPP